MFGMGTGGSLRLLSPEIVWLFSSLLSSALQRSPRLRFSRTFKTAQDSQAASLPVAPLLSGSACASPSVRFALARFAPRSQFKTLPSLFLSSLCLPVVHRSSDFPAPQLLHWLSDQALGRLVSPSFTRYRASTDDLSTWSSPRGLTRFRDGNSLLWVGFTLRCLQRLSSPHFASQLCRWHDNCCTRGASIPVLSY